MNEWPPALSPAAFHGVLGDWVRRLEPESESDPAAILLQALVGFGNLIGRTAYWVVEADRHYCALNCVLVGNSAKARKGVSWRRVQALLANVDPTWPKPASGLSSGEGLIHAVRDGTPMEEVSTGPDGPPFDPGVADKRLLVTEEEFGRALKVLKRDGNILSAVIRQAFDTGDLRSLTRNSPARATGAHISIIGHITRQELLRHLDHTEYANGFANRFLWVCVRRSKELPEGGSSLTLELSDVEAKLKEAHHFSKSSPVLLRDPEAAELWRSDYSYLTRDRPGLLGGVVGRAETCVMRVASIFAVLDCSKFIRADHLRAGLAVWRYCEDSAAHIFSDSVGDPDADLILHSLRHAKTKGLTRTEISQLFYRNKSSLQIDRALTLLAENGLAANRITASAGRNVETWFAK